MMVTVPCSRVDLTVLSVLSWLPDSGYHLHVGLSVFMDGYNIIIFIKDRPAWGIPLHQCSGSELDVLLYAHEAGVSGMTRISG